MTYTVSSGALNSTPSIHVELSAECNQWRNYNFWPPPANIRYGLTKNTIRVTSDPLYRFGPLGPRLGPGIAGSADG